MKNHNYSAAKSSSTSLAVEREPYVPEMRSSPLEIVDGRPLRHEYNTMENAGQSASEDIQCENISYVQYIVECSSCLNLQLIHSHWKRITESLVNI